MKDNDKEKNVKDKITKFEQKINDLRREKEEQNLRNTENNTELKLQTLHDGTKSEPIVISEKQINSPSFVSAENELLPTKECWICLSSDPFNFIKPCQCKGSTKYVHRECFLDYIQTKSFTNIKCTFCKSKYLLKSKQERFIAHYEKIKRFNSYVCNVVFIFFTILITYTVLFIYGATVVVLFVGKDDLFDYARNESFSMFPFSLLNIVRLAINLPIVPVCLLLSTHKKFSYIFHILPSFILFDKFETKYLFLYFSPLLLFLYNKFIALLENKFGKKTGEASILVNNHQFELKIIVGTLISPFVGIFIGQILFRGYTKKAMRSFIGCLIYTLVKDFMGIYYLICLKKRINTLEIGEYDNVHEKND